MVQFTDLHLDLEYTPGAAKHCDQILCCRASAGFPSDPSQQASPYGEYGCDVPMATFELMGDFINTQIKPDVLFWTGDIPPHDMWNYNLEYVQNY